MTIRISIESEVEQVDEGVPKKWRRLRHEKTSSNEGEMDRVELTPDPTVEAVIHQIMHAGGFKREDVMDALRRVQALSIRS